MIRMEKDNKPTRNLITVIISIGVAFLISNYVVGVSEVVGYSMSPEFNENDQLILNKTISTIKKHNYKKGDTIVFEHEIENESKLFIKRVIAKENDTVNIVDGSVYVNDKIIKEKYLEDNSYTEELEYGSNFIIPKGYIYVLGDNRKPGGSNDSRSFGAIDVNKIKGKVIFRIYPFDKFGKI